MSTIKTIHRWVLGLITLGFTLSVNSEVEQRKDHVQQVTVDQDGTVQIPANSLPLSVYMSDQAKQAYISLRLHWPADVQFWTDIAQTRRAMDDHWLRPYLQKAKAIYAVNVEETKIAGIRSYVVTPQAGIAEGNKDRVLINLHGGGLFVGAGTLQQIEAIPIAATGRIKVVSIDYRQAPEFQFPAASVDIAAVYGALLKQYAPQNIGIYGTSTGGTLTAMALAWFEKVHLPRPGAIGLISAAESLGPSGGDLLYMATPLHAIWGSREAVPGPSHRPAYASVYLAKADINDPLVSPLLHFEMLRRFPPTLIITGTRDRWASGLIHAHRQLFKAGVDAELQIWDGMWHGFSLDVDLPESKEMYDVTTAFFVTHLGRR